MYDEYEYIINKDINLCFLSGTIISEPDFKFFYNIRKLISKAEFTIKTEEGFLDSKKEKSVQLKIVGYNEMADYIYKSIKINKKIIIKGFLEKGKVIAERIWEGA